MTTSKKEISCPTCGKKSIWSADNPYRPFCSDRCKLIDLGAWAEGKHRVPGEPANPSELPDEEDQE
jgi:endogenous inhibitor of DNA gyrase (YacG/DUF329 family)